MIDDAVLAAIASEHGTPAYVYDLDAVVARASALRAALPTRVELAYAVKANPSLAVLARLAEAGLGADVASGGELLAARAAGFDPATTILTGPGKRDDELAAAVEVPLRAVTVESPGELERLRLAAERAGTRVRVMLRAAGRERPGNVIGSGQGRFGMRPADLLEAARRAVAAPELDLVGVHRFDASNVLDAGEWLAGARETVERARGLAREIGSQLELVDVGGGLGIPYADGAEPLDVERIGRGLRDLLEEVDREPLLAGARLVIEPGRWLVGPCGVYLARVVDVKEADAGPIVTVDGGVHHLLRPALVGVPHRIRSLVAAGEARPPRDVLVGGPLCTSLDVLGRAELPAPRVGDLLAVADAGAYGFTESMPYFLSHPVPPEIAVVAGRSFVARPRLDPSALLAAQATGAA